MSAHDRWGIPIKGEKITVHGPDGIASQEEVETVDMAGLPVVGGPRLSDFETYAAHSEVARGKVERRLARSSVIAMDPELDEMLLDMGGIGGRQSSAA